MSICTSSIFFFCVCVSCLCSTKRLNNFNKRTNNIQQKKNNQTSNTLLCVYAKCKQNTYIGNGTWQRPTIPFCEIQCSKDIKEWKSPINNFQFPSHFWQQSIKSANRPRFMHTDRVRCMQVFRFYCAPCTCWYCSVLLYACEFYVSLHIYTLFVLFNYCLFIREICFG